MSKSPNFKYDLSQSVSQFLDLHLIFPILQFLNEKKIYKSEDLMNTMKTLLKDTNFCDYACKNVTSLTETEKKEFEMKKEKLDVTVDEYTKNIPITNHDKHTILTTLIEHHSEELDQLVTDKTFTMDFVKEKYQTDLMCLREVMNRAKFFHDAGLYAKEAKYLHYFCLLCPPDLNSDIYQDKGCIALWGLLAAEILCCNWSRAVVPFMQLKETIEGRLRNPNQQELLQERSYLLHWGLFIYFTAPVTDQNILADLCLTSNPLTNINEYISALQTSSPWLLRYLTCAVMMEPKRFRMTHIKELSKILKIEQNGYSDPIVEFIYSLLITVDFKKAQNTLSECESLVATDFFFNLRPDFGKCFMDSARSLMFETYCRIHQVLDLTMLATDLQLSVEDAEKWIVELIRTSALNVDAKIDSKKSVVYLEKSSPTIYEQVYEKGKPLSDRTSLIVSNIARSHQTTYP